MKTLELEKFGMMSMEERKMQTKDDWPKIKQEFAEGFKAKI